MKSKRQTMSKMARERDVRAQRARKLEKKYAAAAERKAKAEGTTDEEAHLASAEEPTGSQ